MSAFVDSGLFLHVLAPKKPYMTANRQEALRMLSIRRALRSSATQLRYALGEAKFVQAATLDKVLCLLVDMRDIEFDICSDYTYSRKRPTHFNSELYENAINHLWQKRKTL